MIQVSDLISRQGVIKAIDKFIPADPMMSDYTQGISVGLAIATRCIEEFSQENHDSSQGLVKDLISRKEMLRTYQELCRNISCSECSSYFCDASTGDCLLEKWIHSLPSIEPETPSNGSITCVKSEKMHDRTTDDLIRRQDAKDAIDMALDHIDHVSPWVYDKLLNVLNEVPSAEKAQLSGESTTKDATSDLISRKELLKQIDIDSDGERGFYGDNWKFIDTIESMPSAESERHLTCKNCIHLGHAYMMPCKNCKRNQMLPDWYEERRKE